MSTMYELTAQYTALLAMADEEEIDPEAIADTFEALEGEIEDKADNVAKILRDLDGEADKIKAEESRLAKRRAHYEASAASLKKRLETMMKLTGKTKFKTSLFSFGIQKNGGKKPLVLDVEVDKLPIELTKAVPDNNAIRAYLEEHEECEFAHFEERGESLRIK